MDSLTHLAEASSCRARRCGVGGWRWAHVAGQSIDARLHGALVLPVGEELTEGDAKGFRGGAQPVAGLGLGTADEFEAAISVHLKVIGEEGLSYLATPGGLALLDRGDGEIAGAAAVAADAVGVGAIDGGANIDRVGVVAALLAHGVEIVHQLRMERIRVVVLEVQGQRYVAGQDLETGSAIIDMGWHRGPERDLSGSLQLVAKVCPALAQNIFVIASAHPCYLLVFILPA